MKDLIKQQEEEFEELFLTGISGVITHKNSNEEPFETKTLMKLFISKVRKETAEYVCDKMVGKGYADEIKFGWNDRITIEKEIKQSILKEFNIGGKQNEFRTQRSADLPE